MWGYLLPPSVTNTDTLIYFTRGHTGATTTVTDTGAQHLQLRSDSLVGTVPNTLAYAALGVTGGSSFSISMGASGGFAELPYCVIAEFAPRSALDAATVNGNTTSLTSWPATAITTTVPGDILVSIFGSDSGSITAPAGF